MDKKTGFKVAGIVLSVVSAGLAVASSFIEEKKLDDKIAEKVAKALEPKE